MKICGCGFANQDEAQVCLACGTSLGVEVISEDESCANRLPRGYLILENAARPTDDPIVVPVPGGILGRAGDFSPEVFSPRVSGIHAVLDFSQGRWFIKHLGRNKSYLLRADEWIELPREQAVELLSGDRLRLADMLFTISTAPDDPREISTMNTDLSMDATDPVERWVVVCPACGARYEVDSPDERVSECTICMDALDKRRIASACAKREVAARDNTGNSCEMDDLPSPEASA